MSALGRRRFLVKLFSQRNIGLPHFPACKYIDIVEKNYIFFRYQILLLHLLLREDCLINSIERTV